MPLLSSAGESEDALSRAPNRSSGACKAIGKTSHFFTCWTKGHASKTLKSEHFEGRPCTESNIYIRPGRRHTSMPKCAKLESPSENDTVHDTDEVESCLVQVEVVLRRHDSQRDVDFPLEANDQTLALFSFKGDYLSIYFTSDSTSYLKAVSPHYCMVLKVKRVWL